MKVILTGATGFIGRNLIDALLRREDISVIYTVSRKKVSHRSEKIVSIKADISKPEDVSSFPRDVDAVFHLAGSYDFSSAGAENYTSNVLATKNLLDFTKSLPAKQKARFFYASTYAVYDPNTNTEIGEDRAGIDVDSNISYVATKASAEEIVQKSPIPGCIFRLGVVTGDSKKGSIVKYDGPYFLLKLFSDIKRSGLDHIASILPLPISKKANIPLVPVDLAAAAFSNALDKSELSESMEVVGCYGRITSFSKIISSASKRFSYKPRILYTEDIFEKVKGYSVFGIDINWAIQKVSSLVSNIPSDSFQFLRKEYSFNNDNFKRIFPEIEEIKYSSYEKAFLKGFNDFEGEGSDD